MPEYFPGLGTLYVDPATLPAGPFLADVQQGNLVSSVYMIPVGDFRAGKAFNVLTGAKAKVDHVDIYYNNGHPEVPDPHYHIVLWHIAPAQVEALQCEPCNRGNYLRSLCDRYARVGAVWRQGIGKKIREGYKGDGEGGICTSTWPRRCRC